jgi:glycerol-3-phosphate O-acyltransferase
MSHGVYGNLFKTNRREQRGIPKGIDMKSISDPATRQKLLRTLGYKVLSDINAVSVVMPTALIGTVLLTLRGRGVGKSRTDTTSGVAQ